MADLPKVAVLCGGAGTRLRPFTDTIPKALVPIHGRPVIEHILDYVRKEGFTRFVLCIGYKGDRIVEHFKEHPVAGIELEFSDAGQDASMLKRLAEVRKIAGERFLVCYGDTITDIDFRKLIDSHVQRGAGATVATVAIRNPFGLVRFDAEGHALSFDEKPVLHYYIGLSVIDAAAFDTYATAELIARPDGEGLVEFFHRLLRERRLFVFQHEGLQITFNTDSERRSAEEQLIRFYTQKEK